MQSKLYRLVESRRVRIAVSLAVVVSLVIGLAVLVGRAYVPAFQEFFAESVPVSPQATVTSTADPTSTPTLPSPKPTESPSATPVPSPTPKLPLTLVWSPEYSQVNLRGEPGGAILRLLDNGSSLHISETQIVRGVEWAHVLVSEGGEDMEGWVAASLVFTIQGALPLAQVTGEEGANLRTEPCGALVAWLPYGTPVQVIETADVEGSTWAHVILPDERRGWVAQRLLTNPGP